MKKLTFASVGLIAVAAALRTAAAADADVYGPPPVVYGPPVTVVLFTWTGFYFGGHVGGAWGHKTESGNPYPFVFDTITPAPASVDVGAQVVEADRVVARRAPDAGGRAVLAEAFA